MMSGVELLSPAGCWDCLKAAVREGADAVYFGLTGFNARMRAENFGAGELADVVEYCHKRGVKAYLAANVLVKNSELEGFLVLAEDAYAAGVDALIIQELSFAGHLRDCFPGMQVHASTQSGVFNSFYSKVLDGVDRVILPREMTLNQVRDFIARTGLDAEVFIQGALCFSVGGQCLMSSFLGGRSGNRGLCAQPCRKKYSGSFMLSTRDLCVGERIGELSEAGVRGFKIEGRLRSPDYVGAATAFYRRLIDEGVFDGDAYADMTLAFSRDYTLGGLFRQFNVTTPARAGKRGLFLGVVGSDGSILLEAGVRVGDGLGIRTAGGVHGDYVRSITRKGVSVDCAAEGERVFLGVNAKTGDRIELSSGGRRRKAGCNRVRGEMMLDRSRKKCSLPDILSRGFDEPAVYVKAYSAGDARAALESGADRVFYSVFARDYPGGGVSAYVPRCLSQWSAGKALRLVGEFRPKSVLCADLGVAAELESCEVILDVSCNAFNDVDVGFFNNLNLVPVISPELSFDELRKFRDKRFVVYAHGRLPLMSTKYALEAGELRDEKGFVFPVRRELECAQVLNSVPTGLFGKIGFFLENGISRFLIDLWGEEPSIVGDYAGIIKGKKAGKKMGYATGNYRKGVA